ncbi:HTH-type transcriptional regulator BetI [Ruminiclostridium hungatei]|uniref:HTH-type transcriptional regulator BetI n=1 Tax=Ruminiclostridium hungatei TaxID=48256 RepID=A0A1V4SQW5_RUMHU|nr:TetR/AcrR family transcriptional regulator [Ruminiclostridium hungatei]OPX46288.1 HTH-type transcriptional regulator BetI [Ruminiclostridium hungatei]
MNPAFENLNAEKKTNIIRACLEEFAQNGYERASTNSMVSRAGISKGLLFHYFGSKKDLYLYLLDYAIEHFIGRFYDNDVKASSDLFERIMKRGIVKMKIASEQPFMYKLVMEAFMDTPGGMEEEMKARYDKIYSQHMPAVFEDIDFSLFREDIDKQKAMEFMLLSFDGIYNRYMKQAKEKALDLSLEEVDKIVSEYYIFIDMIKYGIYKKN